MLLPEADCDYLENNDWELQVKLSRLEAENSRLREEVDRLSRHFGPFRNGTNMSQTTFLGVGANWNTNPLKTSQVRALIVHQPEVDPLPEPDKDGPVLWPRLGSTDTDSELHMNDFRPQQNDPIPFLVWLAICGVLAFTLGVMVFVGWALLT